MTAIEAGYYYFRVTGVTRSGDTEVKYSDKYYCDTQEGLIVCRTRFKEYIESSGFTITSPISHIYDAEGLHWGYAP